MADNEVRRVLVVDDDHAIRELEAAVLEFEGYQVIEADTGDRAIELAKTTPLVAAVLDLCLPGLYGASIASGLKALRRSTRVVLVSALPAQVIADDASTAGADAFLTKPFDVDDLVRAVRGEPLRRRRAAQVPMTLAPPSR